MLPEGIYEEIINQKLKNELGTMDSYEVTKEKLDVEEARKMLASYITAVTRRALLFVRDGEKDDKVPQSKGGNESSLVPDYFRVLERVERGKYRMVDIN